MLSDLLKIDGPRFFTHEQAEPLIREACEAAPDVARFVTLGKSEAGRPLYAAILGRGERRVSLVAGAHADEPVGPQNLRQLCLDLPAKQAWATELLNRFTFVIVPHVNPDGEANNQPWIERWPDPLAFMQHAVREPPGRDVEFGYPDMRPENRAVAALLQEHAPFDLHISLHGMAVSEGAWLLIDRDWIDRTSTLRRHWTETLAAADLPLFDWDRGGDKGFAYIGPGFSTTPRGSAMREHFEAEGDPDTAGLFHDSSMEYVQRLGGDPLCLVTELPLFLLRGSVGEPGRRGEPATFLQFKNELPRWRMMLERGEHEAVREALAPYQPQPVPLHKAVALQARVIDLALQAICAP